MKPSNANLETSQQNNTPATSQQGTSSVKNADVKAVAADENVRQQQQQQQQTDDKPLSLADLFARDKNESDSDENREDKDNEDDTGPVETLEQLTKRLNGMTPEQVYAIKVPMPDGAEPLTIGELKDRVGELVGLEQRELAFDQRRVKQEAELVKARNEMREILQMLPPKAISQEVIRKLRTQHEEIQTRERAYTLEVIPDWENDGKRLDDLKGMATWLEEEYGFPPTFLETIVDHRAMKFVRDMFLRDRKIKAALAKVETNTSKNQRASGKAIGKHARPSNTQSNRRASAPTQREKIATLFNKRSNKGN